MPQASITAEVLADTTEARRAARWLLLAAVWRGVARAAAAIAAWNAERRRARNAMAQLSRLSDRMLKDIGVARHDIERIARYGRDATDIRA